MTASNTSLHIYKSILQMYLSILSCTKIDLKWNETLFYRLKIRLTSYLYVLEKL